MADGPKTRVTIAGETVTARPGAAMSVGPNRRLPVPDHALIHEAGHAVVAHALGWRVVNIEPDGDGYRTGFEVPEQPTPTEHFMLAAASMAGGAAQQQAGVEPDGDEGCAEDLDLAIGSVLAYLGEDPEAFAFCGADRLPDRIDPALRLAGALALDLVKARWSAVERIAAALRETARLGADTLQRLLDGGDDG